MKSVVALRLSLAFLALIAEFGFDDGHEKIFVLSLVFIYVILYLGVWEIYKYLRSTIGLVLNIIIFVRLGLLPILILFDSNYLSYIPLGYGAPNGTYFVPGVILLIYESLVIGFYLDRKLPKVVSTYDHKRLVKNFTRAGEKIWWLLLVMLLLFVITLFDTTVYQSRMNVYELLQSDAGEVVYEVPVGVLHTLSSIACSTLLLFLPIPFLTIFTRKYYISYRKKYYLFSLAAVILGYGIYINGASRASVLIPLLMSLIFLGNVFPKQRRSTIMAIGVVIVAVLVISTIWKTFTRVNAEVAMSFSDYINMIELYFVGIGNMGKALAAKIAFDTTFRLDYLINDLLTTVPYLSHYSNLDNTATSRFNVFFGGRTDQVMPAIGNGLFYFGYLLSPLVTITQIHFASIMEKQANKSHTLPKFVIFTYGAVMLIYGCYSSIVIFVQKLVNVFGLSAVITYVYDRLKISE